MHKLFLISFLFTIVINANAQKKNESKQSIGLAIPVIWNNSEATYYGLGTRKTPTGKGISYGVNLNYSKVLYKGFFAKLGIGAFKQKFGIIRPLKFNPPNGTRPLVQTKSYEYSNFHLITRVGYN